MRARTDVDYGVRVAYTVPVEVIVDLREGEVDGVVVIDEGIEIAESSDDWPRWQFGF